MTSAPTELPAAAVSPEEDRAIATEVYWLPAPDGPFMLVQRLSWPKPDALNGTWTAPLPERI